MYGSQLMLDMYRALRRVVKHGEVQHTHTSCILALYDVRSLWSPLHACRGPHVRLCPRPGMDQT
jgi:hypothetical protein